MALLAAYYPNMPTESELGKYSILTTITMSTRDKDYRFLPPIQSVIEQPEVGPEFGPNSNNFYDLVSEDDIAIAETWYARHVASLDSVLPDISLPYNDDWK